MAAKMFSLASCGEGLDMSKTASALCLKVYRIAVMLFYDIAITFGDEVEKIWKQRFTGATVLWFMVSDANRILLLSSMTYPGRIDIYHRWVTLSS